VLGELKQEMWEMHPAIMQRNRPHTFDVVVGDALRLQDGGRGAHEQRNLPHPAHHVHHHVPLHRLRQPPPLLLAVDWHHRQPTRASATTAKK